MTTAAHQQQQQQQQPDSSQLCTFMLGNLVFGIDVMSVQEVIRHQEMTPVPLTSSVVRGLINLRGQIVTAIDMRARLGLRERDADADLPMNVVVRTPDGGVVSLLVDAIGDVVEVNRASFERVPETLFGRVRDHVRGVYKLESRLLLLLDAGRVAALGEDTFRSSASSSSSSSSIITSTNFSSVSSSSSSTHSSSTTSTR